MYLVNFDIESTCAVGAAGLCTVQWMLVVHSGHMASASTSFLDNVVVGRRQASRITRYKGHDYSA